MMKIKGLGTRDSGIKEFPNPLIPRQRGDKKIKICVICEICGLFSGETDMPSLSAHRRMKIVVGDRR
ncbi:MAG: hypothetical protein AB1422_00980 [bacterium]